MTQDSPTETSERALLFVMMDMPAEHDEEFNRWYAEEHLPERANLPGFGTARRFKAVAGEPRTWPPTTWIASRPWRPPSTRRWSARRVSGPAALAGC